VLNDAYYFIDNIEIVPVDAASQCICGKADKLEADLIYSRSSAKSPGMTPQQMIQASGIYFAALSDEIPAMFETDITEIARIMTENASIKLELIGHSDAEETPEAKITPSYAEMAKKRAEAVKTALVNAGVSADRIKVTSKDDTSPANTKATPMAKAQNRRVELIAK
jgi:outer membrane protein OmpA-like peptidoglycan-associated protein